MSRIVKLLNNETIEIVEYSKANACFQTNKYPNDELFCVIREQFNPFDMFQEKLSLEKEIDRLNNIIDELEKWIEEHKQYQLISERYIVWEDKLVNKLKELKENNK